MDLHLPHSFQARFHGEGSRTVVMGHGFGTDQTSWQPQVEALVATGYRVLTYDIAGSTPKTLSLYQAERHGSVFGFAEDLIALLRALGVEDAHYVGHSASGMIGMVAANDQPGLFRSLSLVGVSPRYIDDPETGYVGGFSREQVAALIASMRSDYAAWANGFAELVVANSDREHLAIEFSRSLLALRPDIASAILEVLLHADLRQDAMGVSIPTQVLQTEHDPAVPLATAEWLARATRAADFQVLPIEGHFPHISHPGIVSAALLEFLGAHAGK